MTTKKLESFIDLKMLLNTESETFLLVYKGSSDVSRCALDNFEKASDEKREQNINFALVDVDSVKDIHVEFGIDSAPSLLIFKGEELKNVIKGCMDEQYYSAMISGKFAQSGKNGEGKVLKNVVLYTTPTCSWCTKIKQHLSANNVSFREINVAANPDMAEIMKNKSGQMGVPQTEINGQMIVGFDRPKIDKLLGIA